MIKDDTWNPDQYDRFKAERQRPFFDLAAMVVPDPGMHVLDLGCGTGELTAILHRELGAAHTLGLDSSPAMLEKADALATPELTFERRDIKDDLPAAAYNLVFSNAALHWVPDHAGLLARLTGVLRPGGQVAIQIPANHHEITYTVAKQVAGSEPFRSALEGYTAPVHVLLPVDYSRLLHTLGYAEQRVELRVYGHLLDSRDAVVEWVKGTTLTVYRERLSDELYERFLSEYRARLLVELADDKPFFFPYNRILLWGQLQE